MKKKSIRWWIVLGVLFVIYSTISFALPFRKNAVFVVSFLFTIMAIGIQIFVIRSAFYHGETVKSSFYGFPIARVGARYLVAQIILSLIFMALATVVPMWLPLVIYTVMFGAAVIGLVSTDAARDEIVQQDVKLVKNVSVMRGLQATVSTLPVHCEDDVLRKALLHLSESFRYSDPVSGESLMEVEIVLQDCMAQLKQAVMEKKHEQALTLCGRVEAVLADRNRLCKLNKGQ